MLAEHTKHLAEVLGVLDACAFHCLLSFETMKSYVFPFLLHLLLLLLCYAAGPRLDAAGMSAQRSMNRNAHSPDGSGKHQLKEHLQRYLPNDSSRLLF